MATRALASSRFNANAQLVIPSKVGTKSCSNVSPGIKDRLHVYLQSPQIQPSKHDNLLPLQNIFEVSEPIPDNFSDFISPDARETGARTAQRLHL